MVKENKTLVGQRMRNNTSEVCEQEDVAKMEAIRGSIKKLSDEFAG